MQISFDGLYANNLRNFFLKKLVQSVSLCHGFQKSTESGSKQRFSLLQEKVVIQALFYSLDL